jgi:hypothetical protein
MFKLQLGPTTTLTVNSNKETQITHNGQTYKITSMQNEKVGAIEFHRYKTQQGEEFLHIPEQKKLAPPYETPWYALPSNTEVYLDVEYKRELLKAAIQKAGGESKLRNELQERGTWISSGYFSRHLSGHTNGMSEDKLIPVMVYLGRDLDEIDQYIRAIGHCQAIREPETPFRLGGRHGTRLLAARYGDGTLCAPRGRGPRLDYANNDAEMRKRFMESLSHVFGGPKMLNKERTKVEVAKVRTSSDVIGHVLKRAGAVVGELADQNPHVPSGILHGPAENRIEWLVQSFGDEGYLWPQKGKVCIGRSLIVTIWLSDDMKQRLGNLKWQAKVNNGHLICEFVPCREVPYDIIEVARSHPPNLLLDEKGMLKELGIESRMYPLEMHQGKYGDHSIHWVLQTETRQDGRRFFEKIGFPQKRKQDQLVSVLRF